MVQPILNDEIVRTTCVFFDGDFVCSELLPRDKGFLRCGSRVGAGHVEDFPCVAFRQVANEPECFIDGFFDLLGRRRKDLAKFAPYFPAPQ